MPTIIPIPAFSDNYIWVLRDGGNAAVVDPGDASPVIAYLEREGLELSAIINTHHHGDHVGGNRDLVSRWPVPVFGPADETIPAVTHPVREGDRFDVPGIALSLSVLDIPGHTAGHVAFAGPDMIFCGDTLFAAGCGRLFEGTPRQMVTSLAKLSALPASTQVYCGHEYTVSNIRFALAVDPDNDALRARQAREEQKRASSQPTLPTSIGEERATNPFLRADEPAIRAAAQRHAGRQLNDAVAVFAELRAWKNSF